MMEVILICVVFVTDGSSSGPPEYTTMLIKVVPQMLNQDDEMSLLSHETSCGESKH